MKETSSTPRRYSCYYYMGFYHTHTLTLTTLSQAYMYLSPPELPECTPLGSLQGSLACPPVPLSHVRRQSAWQGQKRRELPGHCSQAKEMAYSGIPHTELPTAGGQGRDGEKGTQGEMDIPGLLSTLSGSPLFCLTGWCWQGLCAGSSKWWPSKKVFCFAFMRLYTKHTLTDVQLYSHCTLFGLNVRMCVC